MAKVSVGVLLLVPIVLVLVVVGGFVAYNNYQALLFDSPERGIYTDSGFTWQQRQDSEVIAELDRLRDPSIVVYHTAQMNPDGTINEHAVGNFLARASALRGTKNYMSVAVWNRFRDNSPNYVDLNSSVNRETLVQSIVEHVVRYNASGLLLDVEPVVSGDPLYLELVEDVVAAVDVPVVVYGFRLRDSLDNHFVWSDEYFAEVASRADYMFLALYNVREYFLWDGIEYTPANYRLWTLDQWRRVQRLGLLNKTFFGIPGFQETFNSDGILVHSRLVENVGNVHPIITNFHTLVFSGQWMLQEEFVMYDEFLVSEDDKSVDQLVSEVLATVGVS